jgi:hypothetical protein
VAFVQITVGDCKLSVLPDSSNPEIELTDFSTDITWLGGQIYAAIRQGKSGQWKRGLKNVTWMASGNAIAISGNVGNLSVNLSYRLLSDPTRLEEKIILSNLTSKSLDINSLRIGLTWTPPNAWFSKRSKWDAALIPVDWDPLNKFEHLYNRSFESFKTYLSPKRQNKNAITLIDDNITTWGWIFNDDRRFMIVLSRQPEKTCGCPLDIFRLEKQPPTLVVGGIELFAEKGDIAVTIPANHDVEKIINIYMPGSGKWQDAVRAYFELLCMKDGVESPE